MLERLVTRAELFRTAGRAVAAAAGALVLGTQESYAQRTGKRAARAVDDSGIVRCAIHPGIGIARVGNSPSEYFVGPEIPGVPPENGGQFKDGQGRIKRQAARFRLFGLNAAGQVVKELTADDADIRWTVHLANKKAAWYQFKIALDIPEASSSALPADMPAARRNPAIHRRHRLEIDPGPRTIKGKRTSGRSYHFDSGTFLGTQVPVGELRTDGSGRLLVLGGFGRSGTPHANNPPIHIANNDGWYDDISDGPVTARVVLKGKRLPVTPAWVIVGPPSYAPDVTSVVTLYDIAYQAHLDGHPHVAAQPVSFTRDIYPILQRFDRLQWVNEGFFRGYGWQGEVPLLDPAMLAQLASSDPSASQARQTVFMRFRDPSYAAMQEDAWPRLYGDDFAQPPRSPRQYLAVTREQYRVLGEWAAGNFAADWNPSAPTATRLHDLPLQERPAALDRAALDPCPGGPFHPGEEATWIMRRPSLYAGLCRLRTRHSSDPPEPDYGNTLTPPRALGPDGPLHRSGPGDITRWMAVPWQTDTANCGSAYPGSTVLPPPLPDLPTFWPAIVPNKILTERAYQTILNTGLGLPQRQAAFSQRVPWIRGLPSGYLHRNAQIIAAWSQLGFITSQPGPGDPSFPSELYVETESGFPPSAGEEVTIAPELDDRSRHL